MATIDDDGQALVEASDADEGRGPRGWVRIVLALALGVLAGAVIALLLPREDGPRRAAPASAEPAPAGGPEPASAGGPALEGGPDPAVEE